MAVAIINTITTIAEVCGLQMHNMNTLVDAAGTRIFSDDNISYTINNVIRFVYANSDEDMEAYGNLFAINTLSVIALNNVMAEAGYLSTWKMLNPFDITALNDMIKTKKESDDMIDIIPMYRSENML